MEEFGVWSRSNDEKPRGPGNAVTSEMEDILDNACLQFFQKLFS